MHPPMDLEQDHRDVDYGARDVGSGRYRGRPPAIFRLFPKLNRKQRRPPYHKDRKSDLSPAEQRAAIPHTVRHRKRNTQRGQQRHADRGK